MVSNGNGGSTGHPGGSSGGDGDSCEGGGGGFRLGPLSLPSLQTFGFCAVNALKPFVSQALDAIGVAGRSISALAG